MSTVASLGKTRRERRGIISFFKRSRVGALLAAFLGLVLSGALVAGVSYSAFTDQTASKGNSFSAATVGLTSSIANSGPIFSASNIFPGATGTKYVTISAVNTFKGDVKFYVANVDTSKDPSSVLSDAITVKVTQGSLDKDQNFKADTSGPNKDGVVFNSTVTNLLTVTSFAKGLGSWTTTGVGTVNSPEVKTFQMTYTFSSSAGDSAQSLADGFDVVWEVQPATSS